jgi:protein-disulfide isomerase
MPDHLKSAIAGGAVGAVLTLVVVFAASKFGLLTIGGQSMHDYLMANPGIIYDMQNKYQAEQDAESETAQQSAVNKLGLKTFFDPRIAFITGPANSKTTIVEFFDYNCPYCRASVPAVKKFYDTHKDARFAFIEFPIKGAESTLAARAAMAARNQPDKYLPFHFLLMNEEGVVDQNLLLADAKKAGIDIPKLEADMQNSKIDLALSAAHSLAVAANVDATPVFIIDGKIREGQIDDDTLNKMTKG